MALVSCFSFDRTDTIRSTFQKRRFRRPRPLSAARKKNLRGVDFCGDRVVVVAILGHSNRKYCDESNREVWALIIDLAVRREVSTSTWVAVDLDILPNTDRCRIHRTSAHWGLRTRTGGREIVWSPPRVLMSEVSNAPRKTRRISVIDRVNHFELQEWREIHEECTQFESFPGPVPDRWPRDGGRRACRSSFLQREAA